MDKEQIQQERLDLLSQINEILDFPLILLSIVWLILIIVDFVYGLSSRLQTASTVIWGIFIADFFVELYIAPKKKVYLKENWLVALSLFLPALRILKLFRGFRLFKLSSFIRSFNLARILSSFNRSIRTVRKAVRQRGLEYVLLLTALVTSIGAAGMYSFERPGLSSYWDAFWWTAMIMTTIGSDYWPETFEGRILTFFLSVYAFAIFGYITAALASLLIGKEKEESSKEIVELRKEVQRLSSEISRFSEKEKKQI
ncbi:potassium channel family protein [Methanosarcina mazei]|nr:potassium channel family protein [Methanosarcina mazei]AKB41717.1 Potassium voltage-gated channel subfamily KQT [Methanosarcina mazei WWM610]AKB68889.1 Potassium voltage-gated channel subfamily KQT [Methanosarcina mazei LYC]MDO5840328.1 ion channel [Methanosarcina mazei]MDY0246644.1 ion channel [Methanosarcina mazei]QCR15859.1 ion transporter [Methanosarcina mazei]